MSALEPQPICPARFAEAIKDLSLSSIHLKVLELRNSIAHLDYSNEQLRPFAEGREKALNPNDSSSTTESGPTGEPDQDCVDAIKENEVVISRMEERIRLIRAEVEARGQTWEEFKSAEEIMAERNNTNESGRGATESVNGAQDSQNNPWTNGTFQTGIIRTGEVVMHDDANASQRRPGGNLTDDELRQRMEEQMRHLRSDGTNDDSEGGMHL